MEFKIKNGAWNVPDQESIQDDTRSGFQDANALIELDLQVAYWQNVLQTLDTSLEKASLELGMNLQEIEGKGKILE